MHHLRPWIGELRQPRARWTGGPPDCCPGQWRQVQGRTSPQQESLPKTIASPWTQARLNPAAGLGVPWWERIAPPCPTSFPDSRAPIGAWHWPAELGIGPPMRRMRRGCGCQAIGCATLKPLHKKFYMDPSPGSVRSGFSLLTACPVPGRLKESLVVIGAQALGHGRGKSFPGGEKPICCPSPRGAGLLEP